MTDKEVLIRMHILQLQQMAFLVSLSHKLNLMMQKTGMPQEDIDEIQKIEDAMNEAAIKQSFEDWKEDLAHLAS